MKTLLLFLKKFIPFTLAIALFVFLGLGIYRLNKKAAVQKPKEVLGEQTAFKKALEPIYTRPERLIIKSVGVDAIVEPVGVADDGSLETPKISKDAGWYKDGAMPSQSGNMIINAHYDDNYGRPAAFYQLKNVKLDDTVSVLDAYGRRYEYKVISYELVGINDPDRLKVFKSDESAKITLITCGGVWIPGKATYDKRLVIKGELIR
jgi:LPXTG-site transpeptidase (sortase) family protein